MNENDLTRWVGVLAKSLAYIAVNMGPAAQGNIGQKAAALEALGLDIDDQAALLLSTPGSVIEMKSRLRRDKRSGGKGTTRGKKADSRRGKRARRS